MKMFRIQSSNGFKITHEQYEGDTRFMIEGEGEDLRISDGYHTMEELYNHRHALFIALCRVYDNYITPLGCSIICWKSKLHSDGTMYDDSFILGMTVSGFRKSHQISYHLPIRLWDDINVMKMDRAPVWDEHTPQDVVERLFKL